MVALKISNIHLNINEFEQRLKKIKSPGKKILIDALKNKSWYAIYFELLYRFELYCEQKLLNYTRQDINNIVVSTKKIGINKVADAMEKQNFPANTTIPQMQEIIEKNIKQSSNNKIIVEIDITDIYQNNVYIDDDVPYYDGSIFINNNIIDIKNQTIDDITEKIYTYIVDENSKFDLNKLYGELLEKVTSFDGTPNGLFEISEDGELTLIEENI